MLQSWIRHRKEAVVEYEYDSWRQCKTFAQGIDPQACVAKTEASFMQRFLDHTKAARKQMGVSQSVPMEPEQTQVTSMASPEVVNADKVPASQDSSQGSQYSVQWEADRDALSRRVAALAEAGILASGAFKQFLQITPLPDRENSENLSQARFDVEQLAFNAKLQSWVDSQTPGVSQSESNMDDALRLSVSESGSGGTGEMTEAEMSSEAEQASDPDRSRSSIPVRALESTRISLGIFLPQGSLLRIQTRLLLQWMRSLIIREVMKLP